jgi:hypothetical protein
MPPHRHLPPPASHDGNVDREHEKAERQHPEAEHRQEAEQAAGHEHDTEADADRSRFWQTPMAVEQADFMGHHEAFDSKLRSGHKDLAPEAQQHLQPRGAGAKLWKGAAPFAIYLLNGALKALRAIPR